MKIYIVLILFNTMLFAQTGSITGKAVEKGSNLPIPGVNIIIPGTTMGTSTALDGSFTITGLQPGSYQLRASAIGYSTVTKTDLIVSPAKPAPALFEMPVTAVEIEGVTVTSGYFKKNNDALISSTDFSYEEIRRAPGGFEDVIRALSVLPGIAFQTAGRNDLIVRGGAPSENLFIIDGYQVQNINHFGTQGSTGGPLSYVNLDFIRETSFSAGGFPVNYGDKLSSVLKIDLRDGRSDKLGGKALISATQFGLNLEGPLTENSSFIFSARRSYLDFIFNAAGFNFVPEYYDFLGKYDYKIDPENELSFLFIGAIDRVIFNNKDSEDIYENSRILGTNQNQYLLGARYRHIAGHSLITLGLSRNYVTYDAYQKDTLLLPVFTNKSDEAENEVKIDFTQIYASSSEFNAGLSAKLAEFKTEILLPLFLTSFGDSLLVNNLKADKNYVKLAGYLGYTTMLTGNLKVSAGLRADYFDGIKDKVTISPRLQFSYPVNSLLTLNLSGGMYHQYPSYIWLQADESNRNLKAARVEQIIAGFEYLLEESVLFRTEAFYKKYSNYPASKTRPYLVLANTGTGYGGADDNYSSFGLEELESTGKGRSEGVEFLLQKKNSDNYYGTLSMTLARTYFTSPDGIERRGAFDQNFILSLSGGYIINENWEVSGKFSLATGNPYTPFQADGTQQVSDLYSARFKPLHKLDIRVDRRWNFSGWTLIAYIDIQNVYNRKYQNSIKWNYREMKLDEGSSIGLLPSIGISAEF